MAPRGASGFYGKLPALGDFVERALPRAFTAPWDAWLSRALAESRAQLGDAWLDVYLTSPLWRFVLSDQACGAGAWAGVLMPSVDRVGRYFPLTVACPLPLTVDPLATVCAAAPWYAAVEQLMLAALDAETLDVEHFAAELTALAAPDAPPCEAGPATSLVDGWRLECPPGPPAAPLLGSALVRGLLPALSLWFNAGAEHAAPVLLAYPGLPAADLYLHLLLGGSDDGTPAAAAAV